MFLVRITLKKLPRISIWNLKIKSSFSQGDRQSDIWQTLRIWHFCVRCEEWGSAVMSQAGPIVASILREDQDSWEESDWPCREQNSVRKQHPLTYHAQLQSGRYCTKYPLSVLSNCYKRSKHLTMFVMFSYLLAMKCFLAVTEWAVDVPSTRCRDFNYPGAVQDLETLSSGGEIWNISWSSHCRLHPLGHSIISQKLCSL